MDRRAGVRAPTAKAELAAGSLSRRPKLRPGSGFGKQPKRASERLDEEEPCDERTPDSDSHPRVVSYETAAARSIE
jgi:hypothetical protein